MADSRFDRAAVKQWRRRVWRELHRLSFTDATECYMGLVMIAVVSFGTGVAVLSEITGCQPPFVRDVLRRMRRARILKGQAVSIEWNAPGLHGDVSVGCDLMAVVGAIQRVANTARVAEKRKPRTRTVNTGSRRPRVRVADDAVFTPKVRKGDAWYQANPKS